MGYLLFPFLGCVLWCVWAVIACLWFSCWNFIVGFLSALLAWVMNRSTFKMNTGFWSEAEEKEVMEGGGDLLSIIEAQDDEFAVLELVNGEVVRS